MAADDIQLSPASPAFYQRLERLIAAHHPHLRQARFDLKTRAKSAQGKHFNSAWAEVDTFDNASEKRRFDFTIWFALDAWAQLNETQRDALMEHELTHCRWDEKGEPLLIPHDLEEFYDILARYGAWWPQPQLFLDAITQMPPPDAAGRESTMPHFQAPAQGSGGYGGVKFQSPLQGSGGYGGVKYQLPGQGSGGYGGVKFSDPHLQQGGDYHTIDVGNGETIELCPACFAAAVQSILADLLATVSGGDAPEQGSGGYGGVKR